MMSWFQLAQLAFALFVSVVIGERMRALCWRLATSDEALRWLLRELASGDYARARAWAKARAESQAARLVVAISDEADEVTLRELLLDLRDEASARLAVLRVAATLGSTLGLLGGILTLTHVITPRAGLLALKAGGLERLTMEQAIATMAIGIATSAACFQALALLRPAAQKLIAQAQQLAAVVVPV